MKYDFSNIKVLLLEILCWIIISFGTSSRMSPEAPVPVVIMEKDYSMPGGAGNVAINLKSNGAILIVLVVLER